MVDQGGTVESVFSTVAKTEASLIVSASPWRLCLFAVMAAYCKQEGRSNRQNPDDLCYIGLSFCVPCSALSTTIHTHFLEGTNLTPPQLAVEKKEQKTTTGAYELDQTFSRLLPWQTKWFCFYIWIWQRQAWRDHKHPLPVIMRGTFVLSFVEL